MVGEKNMKKLILILLLLVLSVTLIKCFPYEKYDAVPGEKLSPTPFFAEASIFGRRASAENITLPFNAVFRLFGGSDREHLLAYRFGNEPTYFEWIALKAAWTDDADYVRELKDKIVSFPQTDNGFLWSWGTSTYWPTGKGEMHYDGLFRYVAAVAELVRWDGNTDLLNETDATTFGKDEALDASEGRTVYEKCKAAMDYAFEALNGKDGLILLTERSAFLADGVSRMDLNEQGEPVWNNTGRAASVSSNYWDNLCFGNCDAYETMLYFHALEAMRDIETFRKAFDKAAQYAQQAALVKKRFNETFWDAEKGRYIACVDADGKRWDPGLTFLNAETLSYGLGDDEKAALIFSWLDGKRVVSGDTLCGKDIMNYTRLLKAVLQKRVLLPSLRFSPVTNTVSIEDLSGEGAMWWYDLEGAITVGKDGNAAYGRHLENGGYIFFPLYYELTARAKYLGANSVAARARDLAKVYRCNGFNSDLGTWIEGMIGEFPENGIVSRVFVSSLCGIAPNGGALQIRPDLPFGIRKLGIDRIRCGDAVCSIKVGSTQLEIEAETAVMPPVEFYPETSGKYSITWTFRDGTETTETVKTNESGAVVLPKQSNAVKAVSVKH